MWYPILVLLLLWPCRWCHVLPKSRSSGLGLVGRQSKHRGSRQKLSVAVVTWNLNERIPNKDSAQFLRMVSNSSDAVVIGVQECEDIRYRSSEGRRSRAWGLLQTQVLGPKYELLCKSCMGGIQLALFAKPHFANLVEGVQSFSVPCGIGNFVANKGSTCLVVRIQGKSIGFINAHLAAHDNKVSFF